MTTLKPVAHSFDTDLGLDYDRLTKYLGGKGANLNIMKRQLGLPVPPGFTIPTPFCVKYMKKHKLTPVMDREVRARIAEMESELRRGLGNPDRPLLVSVRSGAPISMPGMMDTILNLGMNDSTMRGMSKLTDELFALDSYRRFLHMYGTTVRDFPDAYYTSRYDAYCKLFRLTSQEFQIKGMKNLVRDYQKVEEIPNDPYEQLAEAIIIVFKSWNSDRAIAYRDHHQIDHNLGTAVTVQAMVFGNLNDNSGTGVLFSRNPSTGDNAPMVNYLQRAQGEDVVAGTNKPGGLNELRQDHPGCCAELLDYTYKVLEPQFRNMVDIEFTIEDGKLYILQVRVGKRTPDADRKILMNLLHEGIITKREFEERMAKVPAKIKPKKVPKKAKPKRVIATGQGSSPGIIWGPALLVASNPKKLKNYILIRRFTEPNDYPVMVPAAGIATAEGGTVSHAAVIARELSKPCVVGAGFTIQDDQATMPGGTVKEGDIIGIDGTTGEIFVEVKGGKAQKVTVTNKTTCLV